jgi:uncharacterized membrane protein YfcA
MQAAVICTAAGALVGAYLGAELGDLINDKVLEPLGAWDATAAAWERAEPY